MVEVYVCLTDIPQQSVSIYIILYSAVLTMPPPIKNRVEFSPSTSLRLSRQPRHHTQSEKCIVRFWELVCLKWHRR